MGIFDSVKKSATKAKIQGEIVLIDREIASIHRAFGVQLYDLLSKAVDANTTPALLKKQPEVAAAFETFYKEIQKQVAEKEAKLKEIDHYEAKKDTRLPATNTQEKWVVCHCLVLAFVIVGVIVSRSRSIRRN